MAFLLSGLFTQFDTKSGLHEASTYIGSFFAFFAASQWGFFLNQRAACSNISFVCLIILYKKYIYAKRKYVYAWTLEFALKKNIYCEAAASITSSSNQL
jgi:hypothetical protein